MPLSMCLMLAAKLRYALACCACLHACAAAMFQLISYLSDACILAHEGLCELPGMLCDLARSCHQDIPHSTPRFCETRHVVRSVLSVLKKCLKP